MTLRDVWPRGLRIRFFAWIDGIVLLALVAAALCFHRIDGQALEAAIRRNLASTELERASQAILTAPYAVLSLLEYDDNTQAGRDAPVLFRDAVSVAKRSLDEVGPNLPPKMRSGSRS